MAASMRARRQLANEIRRIRTDATDHTIGTAAEALGWNKAKVSRIETACVGISRPDLLRLCVRYELADDEVAKLEQLLILEDDDGEWWRAFGDSITASLAEYISLETQPSAITIASASIVPGLLQTQGYMAAITGGSPFVPDPETLQSVLEVRTRRQAILRGDSAPTLTTVLSPAVLLLQPGGTAVHKEQLRKLLDADELPNITVRMSASRSARWPRPPMTGGSRPTRPRTRNASRWQARCRSLGFGTPRSGGGGTSTCRALPGPPW